MNFNNSKVDVVYCCSDYFSEVCGVSITSLFENNQHLERITVYLIEDSISEANRNRLNMLAEKYHRNICYIQMPNPSVFFEDERFTKEYLGHTFARLLLGELIPKETERIISLDSDTIILKKIDELWNWNLDKFGIAGVDDCLGKIASVRTQHLPQNDSIHCNAGMYLVDLDSWRAEKWTEMFKEYIANMIEKGLKLGGYEEEVIANVLEKRMLVLPPQFNLMTLEQVLSYDELMNYREPVRYYTKEEIEYAKINAVITHTTNLFWVKKRAFEEYSDHPMHFEYEKYREISPWNNLPHIQSTYSLKNSFQKNIWHVFPRKISLLLAKYVRNYLRPLLQNRRDDE